MAAEISVTLDDVERAAIELSVEKAQAAAQEARSASAAARKIARTILLRHGHDLPDDVPVRVVAKADQSGVEALAFEPGAEPVEA